jgi:hypothetical protein
MSEKAKEETRAVEAAAEAVDEGVQGADSAEETAQEATASAPENAKPERAKGLCGVDEPPQPVGDASRWKSLDSTAIAYEIKDRGVIMRSWGAMTFIPGTKLAPDINNGFRIVAA